MVTRVAVAAAVVATGLAVAPSPASAAGGGCSTYVRNGWNIGVCSSDNGATVFGDVYVNARGSLGSSCYIYFSLNKDSLGGGDVAKRQDGCYSGRHGAISAPMSKGTYYTYAVVVVDGYNVNYGFSPNSTK
ncbi:hypothetical protein Pme01_23880 [Planosporangium mesophilum]|uniref:Spore-associated protein A n=2 Tax=Planosporangium mesophilum TaxID=689768 RepID=A0A8J3X0K1_9ACTN|nr:hypothetical protein Pme01_23880 [Planosporangium mesophilum]